MVALRVAPSCHQSDTRALREFTRKLKHPGSRRLVADQLHVQVEARCHPDSATCSGRSSHRRHTPG